MRIPSGSCSRGNFCAPSRWGAEGALPTAERAGVKVFSRRCSLRAQASERRIAELKTLLGKTVVVQVRGCCEAERAGVKVFSGRCSLRARASERRIAELKTLLGKTVVVQVRGCCEAERAGVKVFSGRCSLRAGASERRIAELKTLLGKTVAVRVGGRREAERVWSKSLSRGCGSRAGRLRGMKGERRRDAGLCVPACPARSMRTRRRSVLRRELRGNARHRCCSIHPSRDSRKSAPSSPLQPPVARFARARHCRRHADAPPLRPSAASFAEARAIAAPPVRCEIRRNARHRRCSNLLLRDSRKRAPSPLRHPLRDSQKRAPTVPFPHLVRANFIHCSGAAAFDAGENG